MTFMIAAAGTGGHVFPGLSVGEALLDLGAPREEILYVGGDRLEKEVYPREGFAFLEVELRGLQRSLTPRNLTLPSIIFRARSRIAEAIAGRGTRVVLGMGGYATVPAAMAARRAGVALMSAEQNAEAGLASRIAARWATRAFGSFPETLGLPRAEWVGNPVRTPFWAFDREALKPTALRRYGIDRDTPVLGAFGGSLGAGAVNEAVASMVAGWNGHPIQVVHITGERDFAALCDLRSAAAVNWRRRPFEGSMEWFYAACDLVVARAGGAVAELTATATPAVLIPGSFGSGGHQAGNARFLSGTGAAVTLEEGDAGRLGEKVESILLDETALGRMREASGRLARPGAAHAVAGAMMEAAR